MRRHVLINGLAGLALAGLALTGPALGEETGVAVVELTLPVAGPEDALSAFDALPSGGVVWLDITMGPGAEPIVDGVDQASQEVPFGPVEADYVSLRTGSNHAMVDVVMGTPQQHAGNLLSANYNPGLISQNGFGLSYRLTGCFYSHAVSIPTAVQWVLHPLAPASCGIGD